MKRGFLMMTVLVVLAVLFASCSNGMSKDDASGAVSGEKVMVNFGVDQEGFAQNIISGGSDVGSDFTYWYKANHNWTQDPSRPVHGDTGENFVLIPNYTSGSQVALGYFTAGQWTFYAQVKKGSNIVYSGSAPYNIFTGHVSPVVTVTPDTTGVGTISITVKVPTTGPRPADHPLAPAGVGEYHESLSVYATPNIPSFTLTATDRTGNLTTFTGSKENLTPGAYTIGLRYTDESGAVTEGAAQAVTVYAGATASITGTIDGGKWHSSQITINAPDIIDFTLSAAAGATSKTPIGTLTYTASARSAQGNALKFEWFKNGISQGDAAAGSQVNPGDPYTSTFDFTEGTYGMYDIACAAIDETGKVAEAMSLYVQVGYAVTAPTSPIIMGTTQTVFAEGDIVPLNYTGNLTNLTVTGVAAEDIEWDNVAHKASFRMPAQTATITGTFE